MTIRSEIPILLCSGYQNKIIDNAIANLGIKGFIPKPIVKKELAQIIRSIFP